ncbi:hypothetical protein [Agrobacterium arsenijevicii]|uniref:hypothetical protein n=1 Tax=Agrobacterium arsenijevicii TaxID=1585697 RepID=UPI003306133E
MFQHDFSLNAVSNRGLGGDLFQSKDSFDRDIQRAASGDIGDRLQQFGVGGVVELIDFHAILDSRACR